MFMISNSAINMARCALSSFLLIDDGNLTVGSHPLTKIFVKGMIASGLLGLSVHVLGIILSVLCMLVLLHDNIGIMC